MPGLTAAKTVSIETPSLLDFAGREFDLGVSIGHAFFVGSMLAVTDGDGKLRFVNDDMTVREVIVHEGPILAAASDDASILTGGDDGRVVQTIAADAQTIVLAHEGAWIDAVAMSRDGVFAWSVKKRAILVRGDHRSEIALPSSCRALAFSPQGDHLAAATYGGVLIVDVQNRNGDPAILRWDGAHLAVRWSPDAGYLVSGMLENELHIWSLADGEDARLGVYPGRSTCFQWSPDGRSMVTAGAPSIVIWPFDGERGPFGRSARVSPMRAAVTSAVGFSTDGKMVGAGHRDGSIVFFDLASEDMLLIRRADGDAIVAVAFDKAGEQFGFATSAGKVGLIKLEDPQ